MTASAGTPGAVGNSTTIGKPAIGYIEGPNDSRDDSNSGNAKNSREFNKSIESQQ
jgi:hypothetical protein